MKLAVPLVMAVLAGVVWAASCPGMSLGAPTSYHLHSRSKTNGRQTNAHRKGRMPAAAPACAKTPSWVAAWGMPVNIGATQSFDQQTVRIVLRANYGGSRVRIRLSNADGRQPLTLSDAHIGIAQNDSDAIDRRSVALTFGGKSGVTIPAGRDALSDPMRFTVKALQDVVVSVYAPAATGPGTGDQEDTLASWYSAPGDVAASTTATGFKQGSGSGYFLTGLDVYAPNDGLIVGFGDSITAGYAPLPMQPPPGGWPNHLAKRLLALARAGGACYSVIDAGIGGNDVSRTRHSTEGAAPTQGISAVARLQRDVLDQTGFKLLLMMEGINDIGGDIGVPDSVPAATLEAAYEQIIEKVRAHRARMLLSPMTQAGDAVEPDPYGAGYWDPAGVAERHAANDWIRTESAVYNPGFDFEPVVEDSEFPNHLRPAYDSGDHLHPNAAGEEAMADSINLAVVSQLIAKSRRRT